MAEYIDKELVIDTIEELKSKALPKSLLFDHLKKVIGIFPTRKFVPVKHGEWESYIHGRFYGTDKDGEPIFRDGIVYYCSECRRRSIIKTKFCPDCGAKMDGGDENAN